jgi:hypothetical protein
MARSHAASSPSHSTRRGAPPGATRFGWPQPSRVQEFRALLNDSQNAVQYRFEFQGRPTSLRILTVPIDLPKYRLENGRTCSLQAEFLARNPDKRRDLFTGDPELEDAQDEQHKLLLSLAALSDLRRYFESGEHKQTVPLILNEDGFVVNGNRRLATWRDLLYGDATTYAHFNNVDVVVLPHCDPRDIDRLEAHLQVEKDIRADYKWDALAAMMKRHQDRNGLSHREVADLYGLAETDVRTLLDMFAYGDEYLTSRGKCNQWSEVSGHEYAFRELVVQRSRIAGVGNKEVFKAAVFALVDNADTTGGSIYRAVKDIAANICAVRDRLLTQFEVQRPAESAAVAELFGGQPVAAGAGGVDDEAVSIALAAHISAPSNSTEASTAIIDAVEAERQLQRDARSATTLLRKCSKAHSELAQAVSSALRADTNVQGVERQLEQIESLVAEIREFLRTHAAS